MNNPLQGKPNTASRDDWATDEETLTKIVAAIEVEVSIRTAILLWPAKGATPLVAFLFFLMLSVRRNVKRPLSSHRLDGLGHKTFTLVTRVQIPLGGIAWLVTVCGCESRWHTG